MKRTSRLKDNRFAFFVLSLLLPSTSICDERNVSVILAPRELALQTGESLGVKIHRMGTSV
jgi:hypothetical protein